MNRNPSMAGLASLVQSRGRNGDSVLVHMAPEEVAGLQSLALAAGGSLTLNPDTGLYEANFLKKLLPTILGFGLNFLVPGLGALGSGLLVGGVEAARTGDLGRGLMAGLGAFGGAGLGSALSGAGAVAGGAGQSAITAAGEAAATEAAKGTFASEALKTAAIEEAKKKAIEEATKKAIAEQAANKAVTQGAAGWTNLKAGASNLFSTKPGIGALSGMDAFGSTFNALPGGMIGKAGLVTTAANALTPEMEMPGGGAYNIDDSYYEGGDYDPATGTFRQGQWRKGYPGFPGYADGGAVMPRPNYNYPQAGITKSNYAQGLDFTKPREILDGYDTKIDPFTGEERFADGGEVAYAMPPELMGRISEEYAPRISALTPPPPTDVGDTLRPFPFDPPPPTDIGRRPPNLMLPPEEPIYGSFNQVGVAPPRNVQAQMGPQSLEQYYQGLLSAPQQQAYDPSFFNYMQSLNRYVTSPVAPPPPPPAPPPPPPPPPGDNRTTPPNNRPGDDNLRWDPDLGQLVNDRGDLFNPRDFNFGDFRNLASAAFRNVGGDFGPSDGRMVYDPVTGMFRQPGSQTVTTPPDTSTTGGDQFKFDPNNFQFNPFVDGFDMSSLPGYQQNQTPYMGQDMPVGNLTGIDQFADPYYDFAGGTQGFDMGNVPLQPAATQGGLNFAFSKNVQQPFQYDFSGLGQMGDMGAYGQQFQGFQPLSTDFGSTYQAPAMQTPTFDYSAYNPQQFDLGNMGYGLGSLPAISSTYQAPTVQTPTFDMSSFQMPAQQTSMMTGNDMGMSNVATAPQFGFGNSDVLYGQSNFGQGGEQNIFGFAEGGSIQKTAAGKLVTGDGDGMSDDIRANINGDQEARLADGEFVIPADVVSHLGNGSTDAGADRLYSMMDRIRKARTGRKQQAPEIDADKYLPA